ncbi:MAG: ArnT family glycosyltransferase [Thermomicrobiales bacterium]
MKTLPSRTPTQARATSADRLGQRPAAPLWATLAGFQAAPVEAALTACALAALALAIGVGVRQPGALVLALCAVAGVALAVATLMLARALTWPAHWWRRIVLVAIVGSGAVLRFRGLAFGLPYVPHPDEPAVVNVAQRMLRTGDLDPHHFVYPSLYIYLQAAVYALHLGWGFTQGLYTSVNDLPQTTDIITTAPGIYLWGRTLTVLLGIGIILLTYGAGKRLYGPRTGLIAALLVAFAPPLVDDGHLITVDVPAAFFTALAFFWLVELYRAPLSPDRHTRWWPIVRAGIGVGLAAATKYNAALIVLPLALVPLLRRAHAPWRVWLGGGLAALATFFLVTPFAIPELSVFLNDTASVIIHYKFQGHGRFESNENWLYYGRYLWQTFGPVWPLALGGLLVMALRGRRADLLVLPFPLLYYAALASLWVNFTRNLMLLYPFLALAAAVALQTLCRWLATLRSLLVTRHSSLVTALVLPFLLVGPAVVAGRQDNLRVIPDTRVAAQRWMAEHLPRNDYWLVETAPQLWPRQGNVIATSASFGDPAQHPPGWYPAHGFRYLLLDRGKYDPALHSPDLRPDAAAWFQEALARFTLVRDLPGGIGPALALFDTGPGAPVMQHPSAARFGTDELALAGYNLGPATRLDDLYFPESGGTPRGFRPGDWLGLTLLWQPLRAPSGDYQVFIHLRDARGRTVAQRDARPQNNTYPTDRWPAGQAVLDSANLALPATLPPGQYTVVIGLYPPGQSRLAARAAPGDAPLPNAELPLATIEVK